ncbi:pilus assembly protein TadG-related protein [Petrachloros mirabilis]
MSRGCFTNKISDSISRQSLVKNERGATAVIVAIMIVVLLGFGALALDISNAMIARNELQNVADAAALAGARQIGVIYQALPTGTPYTGYTINPSVVYTAATGVASQNQARQVAVTVNIADIQIGVWNSTTRTLAPITNTGATGVRVTARRDGSANGPVATWLAGVMGINSMNVVATATAALTGTGVLLPGEANAPFGIDDYIFSNPAYCGTPIQFYPTNNPPTGCAGWHTFEEDPPNAATERRILRGLTPNPPTYETPGMTAGETTLEYIGGNLATNLSDLYNLWDAKKVMDTSSPSGWCWHVTIPVYPNQNCSNPVTTMGTVGFASACVWEVQYPPIGQVINAFVECGKVTQGQGGGGSYGTLGSIPGLVE